MEPNYKASLVINSIFQLGLLTFAVVLGVVCNDISAAVEAVQSGNYAVVESGHTVILNWNKLTIPILRQVSSERSSCFQDHARSLQPRTSQAVLSLTSLPVQHLHCP